MYTEMFHIKHTSNYEYSINGHIGCFQFFPIIIMLQHPMKFFRHMEPAWTGIFPIITSAPISYSSERLSPWTFISWACWDIGFLTGSRCPACALLLYSYSIYLTQCWTRACAGHYPRHRAGSTPMRYGYQLPHKEMMLYYIWHDKRQMWGADSSIL